jgi:hypothetical protein
MLYPARWPWLQHMGAVRLWERSFAARRGLDSSFEASFDPAGGETAHVALWRHPRL